MPSFDIRGVSVQFPFEPYEPQKKYMEKVLEGLQKRQNAVLESPAGTGKTLSLLCATLGWLANEKWKEKRTKVSAHGTYRNSMAHLYAENIELTPNQRTMLEELRLNVKAKIIYVCRTHTQASKAMKELKNTSYFPVRALVLGSRDLLCTHPDVAKAAGGRAAKSSLCQQKVKSHTCSFYNRVERTKNRPEFRAKPILDIEDLVSVGGKLMACPYYLSRELIQSADVLFMSYNYLFDAQIHKSNELDVRHSIIIFHEAHNVGKICENSCSTRIRSSDVALAISETTALMTMTLDAEEIDSEEETEIVHSDVFMMEEILLNLQKEIHAIPVISSPNGTTLNGTYIFRLLEKANITFDNVNKLLQILVWQTTRYNILREKGRFEQRAIGLQTLFDFLKMVYAGNGTEYCQSIERSFRLHIETEEHAKVQSTSGGTVVDKRVDFATTAKVLNFWCVNAGFAMRQLLDANPRNIILTSSAIGPLEPFISELAIPVKVTLENSHIVDRSKVCVKVVSHGPDRVELISSELSRANPQYVTSLGRTVLSLCPIIPGGVLVFFPSYPVLGKCVEDWQASGIWAQINRTKPIFVEPRGNESLSSTVGKYYARLREPANRGAIFMAVCRGKVSEGLDFSDANCRAVLITGLPFPPKMDARVVLKKEYLDRNRTKENELITGNDWYGLEASRAVNQAIGRVIRHKDDYGAILLCDSRFQNKRQHVQLTSWIQDHLRDERATRDPTIPNFGKVIGDLSRFYRAQNKSCDSAATASNVSKTKKTREKRKLNVAAPQHNFCSEFRLSDYLIPPSTIACQTSFMTARELFHTQMSRPTQSINFNEVGVNKLYTGKLLTNRESSQVSKASTISSHSKSVMHEPVMVSHKETLVKPEASQKETLIKPVASQKETIFKPEAPQQETLLKPEAPQQETLFKPDAPQQETLFKPEAPRKESLIKPEASQKETLFKSEASQKETHFNPKVAQKKNLCKPQVAQKKALVKTQVAQREALVKTQVAQREAVVKPEVPQKETPVKPKVLLKESRLKASQKKTFVKQNKQKQKTVNSTPPPQQTKWENFAALICDGENTLEVDANKGISASASKCQLEHKPNEEEKRLAKTASKRHSDPQCNIAKSPEDRKKTNSPSPRTAQESRIEILRRVKKSLQTDMYKLFLDALLQYQSDKDFSQFIMKLCICFEPPSVLHLFKDMRRFVNQQHKQQFDEILAKKTK